MKTNRVSVFLSLVNLVTCGLPFAHGNPDTSDPVAPIVRAREIQLLDDQGRESAQLNVWRAQPDFRVPDASIGRPEIVELYRITSKGHRNIKFGASEDDAGLIPGGDKGYVQLPSRGVEYPFITIVTKDGRGKMTKP